MAAALLTAEPVHLQNIPHVRDIITMAKLLAHMRCRVESPDIPPSEFTIQAENVSHAEAPYELVKTMRASVLTLGPLVARFGYARVSLPGGCAIGARPIDMHIQALEKLGADNFGGARLRGSARQTPARREFRFPKITVTGTENILTAAVLAEGETVLENCALEPEITDLAELLIKMGAQDRRRGHLHDSHPRRRKTSTAPPRHHSRPHRSRHFSRRRSHHRRRPACSRTASRSTSRAVIDKLEECGVEIRCEGKTRCACAPPKSWSAADVTTEEYPGFATDMQAQFMALATQAHGVSRIRETIFENRYLHASEMMRMGANIAIDGNLAIVTGPTPLSGAPVTASDLRASAGSCWPRWSRTTPPGSTAFTTSTAATSESRQAPRPRRPHRTRHTGD